MYTLSRYKVCNGSSILSEEFHIIDSRTARVGGAGLSLRNLEYSVSRVLHTLGSSRTRLNFSNTPLVAGFRPFSSEKYY